jgi:hypothetical protein
LYALVKFNATQQQEYNMAMLHDPQDDGWREPTQQEIQAYNQDQLNNRGLQFKKDFICTFLATWCANNYTSKCMSNQHQDLYNPPWEDAIDIADEVWLKLKEHMV